MPFALCDVRVSDRAGGRRFRHSTSSVRRRPDALLRPYCVTARRPVATTAVSLWFHQNTLLLKTEAVLFATRQRLIDVDFNHTTKLPVQILSFRRRSSCLASRWTLLYQLISTLPTSSVRVISTFGRCDICNRCSPLSWQNRWQLPLLLLGSIIATASCTALRSGTSTISRRCRTRQLASCIRLPSKRAPRLCANSCTGYQSDNGSHTS